MYTLVLPPDEEAFVEACKLLDEEGTSYITNRSQCRITIRTHFGTKSALRDKLVELGCQIRIW